MKLRFSPLIAGMSGKAADAVAATWKGRPYVRSYVIPKNPRTASQQSWRAQMGRQAQLYRSLGTDFNALAQKIADSQKLSAFNLQCQTNLDALYADRAMPVLPGNPDLTNVLSIALDGGTSDGAIEVTATLGTCPGATVLAIATAPVDPDEEDKTEPNAWTIHALTTGTLLAAGVEVVCQHIVKEYHVAVFAIDAASIATATKISGGVAAIGTSVDVI